MPPSFFPLDSQTHRAHGWHRPTDFRFATDTWVPVLLSEISALLDSYPLAFIVKPDGGYQLNALLGLLPGQNLFVDAQGRWRVSYVPSYYRSYPFALGQATVQGQSRTLLCFNRASGLYREAPDVAHGEQRFFDDAGGLQPPMQKLVTLLQATQTDLQKTQQAVDALQAAGLLAPWTPNAEQPAPASSTPASLCRIDAAKLAALDAHALAHLRDVGALPIAYAQLFSVPRLRLLRQFQALQQSIATAPPTPTPTPTPTPISAPASAPEPRTEPAPALPPVLASLLGEGQDSGTLNFNWLTKK